MTLQIPTLLALLGTALMAVAIFAPRRSAAPAMVSFAAPSPAAAARWAPASAVELSDSPAFEAAALAEPAEPELTWPALVDLRAAGCDLSTRLALLDALTSLRGPWADAILARAWAEERDVLVRATLAVSFREGEQAT
jgi:hypothetical protein